MCFALFFLLLLNSRAQSAPAGLYAQATTTMLAHNFPSPRVDYLLVDIHSGQTIAERWPDANKPVPVGSLLKPFVALAYSELLPDSPEPSASSPRSFPVVHCHGKSDGCWRAGGHGSLGLEAALAGSCNAYFLALARDLAATRAMDGQVAGMAALQRVSAFYGLPSPPEFGTDAQLQRMPQTLIGLDADWRVTPAALVHAYAVLAAQSRNKVVQRLLTGLKLAADRGGTAAKIGEHLGGVLAKTGTAPCVPESDAPRCLASGDGLVVAIFPAEEPKFLLLVRRRGTTGAVAAELAGKMLSRLEPFESGADGRPDTLRGETR